MINDPNLECLKTRLKTLKQKRWSVPWNTLETLEERIKECERLLEKGVSYEPRF